eukprot:364701-Chlamydomonas_euryale.AAC.2
MLACRASTPASVGVPFLSLLLASAVVRASRIACAVAVRTRPATAAAAPRRRSSSPAALVRSRGAGGSGPA